MLAMWAASEGEGCVAPSIHGQLDVKDTHATPTSVMETWRRDTHCIRRVWFPNNTMPYVLNVGGSFPEKAVLVLGIRDVILL
jgi:hypothetical protein